MSGNQKESAYLLCILEFGLQFLSPPLALAQLCL